MKNETLKLNPDHHFSPLFHVCKAKNIQQKVLEVWENNYFLERRAGGEMISKQNIHPCYIMRNTNPLVHYLYNYNKINSTHLYKLLLCNPIDL